MNRSGIQPFLLAGGYCLLLPALFLLKTYRLQTAGLPDFDSVTNLLIAKEIAAGNFTQMFAHASPTFNLLLGFLTRFTTDFIILEYLNGLIILAAVFLVNRFLAKHFRWLWWEELLVFAASGSSLILTYLSRGLTFEGLSLLFFVLFFRAYYKSLAGFSERKLYVAATFFAFLLTINYKALVLLPIIVLLEIYQQNRKLRLKNWLICCLIPAGVFVAYSVLGMLLKLPWNKYLFVSGAIAFQPDDHPNRDFSFFNTDLFFYLKYFWFFENPALLLGLLVLPFTNRIGRKIFNRRLDAEIYAGVFAGCLVAGMSVVQKAPRGILYAYPLLYALTYALIRQVIGLAFFRQVFLVVFIGFNVYAINQHIYKYAHTNYPQLAEFLVRNNISKVAATVSNQAELYLPEGFNVKVVQRNADLKNLKAEGYNYLIVDDYAKITCIELDIKYRRVLKAYPEPNLLSPITALEHCEYSGLSFQEGLAISDNLKAQRAQLFLVEL